MYHGKEIGLVARKSIFSVYSHVSLNSAYSATKTNCNIKILHVNLFIILPREQITHAQIQDFFQGGGGSRPDCQKTVWTTFFFVLVLNLFYSLQRWSNGFIKEETILFQGSRGGPTFFFGGGGEGSNLFC